jgi:IPT/TIG domain-containing protein
LSISWRRSLLSTLQVLFRHSFVFSIFFLLGGFFAQAQAQVAFVQSNFAVPHPIATSVTIPFTAAQTAGDLNVVVVGWNDSTAQVSSVVDSSGNSYSVAVGPTVQTGLATQAIFCAKNILPAAANGNIVTVTFTAAAVSPDIRIAEYKGLDTVSPLDVVAAAQGSSALSSSGAVTTTNANDLLVGANLVQTATTGPGVGYTSRVITTPDGDILEDQAVTATGSYSATAPDSPAGGWIMQLVAFRAASGGGGTAQSVTATAGTPQSATINTAFATALQATVKDSLNNPVSGVTVTFVAPASGASGTFAGGVNTAVTNAQGVATAAIFTANGTAGGPYNVTASVAGVATPANFSLTNLPPTIGWIALVQHTSKDAGTTTSSSFSLAFVSANAAGNWIAVVIRAGKSGQVFTVTDSKGNTYRKAIQFNETVDGTTLGIFYAENIFGGPNTVTVSDTISGTMRFAILEYSGVALANSLDGAAVVGQGTSASPSMSLTTTANGDLLLAAISTANPANFTAGSGYSIEETVPAEPNTKLIAEDRVQTTAGSASASASLGASDNWGAALAAFKAANGGGGTVPNITSLNPASGAVGALVTITGTNFGGTQGTNTVTFGGTSAGTASSWSATSITMQVPAIATGGANVVVHVGGATSNGVIFTVIPPPSITSLSPTSGSIGSSVTVTGTNFGATQGTSAVTFNGIAGTPTSWNATSIVVPVPNGATTGNVVVTVGGVATNGVPFSVTTPGPSLSTLSMTQGPVGATVTITGTNFGASQGTNTVTFGTTSAGAASNWGATSIDVKVPVGATTGNVVVTVGGVPSNGLPFNVTPPPSITSISPTSGSVGMVVTINGANFGPTVGTRTSVVSFNGTVARPNTWADTVITVPVPSGATTGNVVVSISGVVSNAVNFTVTLPPSITSLNPTFGPVSTSVTITGTNFGATQNTSTVAFNGTATSPASWSDTSIQAPVPTGATTGNVVVTVGGAASNGVSFSVAPAIGGIALVQHTSKDAGTATSSSLAFVSANTAGNWIAVVIRAGMSGQVFTVADSRANTYRQAVQFNQTVDSNTLGIFYAESIAGGANTITVSDTISGIMRFAILEYSGVVLKNSLDVSVAAQGTSASPNSGNATTVANGDLLLGAILTGNAATFTAGNGYSIEETVPAGPNTKLIAEDQIQITAGPVSASASLGTSDNWGAALAAFRSASGTAPPISVSLSPTTASVSTGSGAQAFTATVQADFQHKGVTFSLSGAGCSGSTCGTLTNVTATTVSYTAPPNVPSPATVTLTATSVTDNTKSATATITVVLGPLTVTVSPKRGSITTSQTQQFTGTVFNDPNNAGVTWQVDGNTGGNTTTGTISTAGLFTPGTQAGLHTITATSVTNASVNTSVSFAVSDLQGVYMHHNDVARIGQNLNEYALTPATVNSSTFSKLFSCPVDGFVYAEPLYVANLNVGGTMHNVVFIATEHDSVYAFDADSPSCVQLWKTSFLGTGVTTMSWLDTGSSPTNDVFPEIGITSTPVIDPATNTIYVEAKTKESVGTGCSTGSPCYVHRLHALNLTTGAEKFGGPVVISAPNFVSLRHFNRPALLLANGTVYIGFGSHGDISNWQGWLFGYDPATLAQKFVFSTSNPTSGNNGASLWSGGAGPAADASGNVYVTTGNGAYDGTSNFSESVLKISPTGSLLDWFTPFNRSVLDANDIDLGSAGVIILPDSVGSTAHPHLALATGKIAILYLLDQTNMGKFNSSSNRDVQEAIPVPPPNTTQLDGGNYGIPAYWNGNIYTTGQNFPLSQFKISNGSIATPQFAVSSNMFPARGATPAVSASGTTNGIVWVLDLAAWPSSGNAILDAYDATNVANLLFSSPASGSGAAGAAVKFTVPAVANGKVYVGGQASFTVFGLLP